MPTDHPIQAPGRVRAKFYVAEISRKAYNPRQATVVLQAVSRGDGNAQWSEATPSGRLEMSITNERAVDALVLGQEYYLDFTPAEAHLNPMDGHAFRPSTGYGGAGSCGECGTAKANHTS